MRKIHLLFGLCLIWIHTDAYPQVNVMGKPGHIMTPSAYWQEGKHLGVSFAYVPTSYAINRFMGTLDHAENIYSVRLALTDFLEVNLNITRIPAISHRIGIGDRHLDVRIKLLKEKKVLPALSLILSPPGSIAPHISHDVLVASKKFDMRSAGDIAITGGYGLPFYIGRASKNSGGGIWNRYPIIKKSENGNNYLDGFFGAVVWHPWDFLSVMAEHDSRNINLGAAIKIKDWLLLQGHSYQGKKFGFSIAMDLPLDFEPKELRSYGK